MGPCLQKLAFKQKNACSPQTYFLRRDASSGETGGTLYSLAQSLYPPSVVTKASFWQIVKPQISLMTTVLFDLLGIQSFDRRKHRMPLSICLKKFVLILVRMIVTVARIFAVFSYNLAMMGTIWLFIFGFAHKVNVITTEVPESGLIIWNDKPILFRVWSEITMFVLEEYYTACVQFCTFSC